MLRDNIIEHGIDYVKAYIENGVSTLMEKAGKDKWKRINCTLTLDWFDLEVPDYEEEDENGEQDKED